MTLGLRAQAQSLITVFGAQAQVELVTEESHEHVSANEGRRLPEHLAYSCVRTSGRHRREQLAHGG